MVQAGSTARTAACGSPIIAMTGADFRVRSQIVGVLLGRTTPAYE